MKKRMLRYSLIVAMSCGTNVTHAMANGFYLGLMMGPATNKARPEQAQIPFPPIVNGRINTTIADPRSTQFASRIYMGNQFSRYAAIEGGVTLFSTIRYDSHGVKTFGGTDKKVRDLDIVGKGIFPFGASPFSIYGKLGMTVTYFTVGAAFNPTYNPPKLSGSTAHSEKFSPTYSLGASYDINQSWQADLSINSVQVGSSIGSVSFYSIGISYHFTDKYCGQFLCDD